MLSHDDNELLTKTGPGTAMGALIRQYWIPVVQSGRAGAGRPRQAGACCSGERLVAFRGRAAGRASSASSVRTGSPRSTSAGSRKRACAASITGGSTASTASAWRCRASRPSRASRARCSTRPTRARSGAASIWAYMGPASPPPPLPDLEFTLLPEANVFISKRVQDCNWFQAMEGGIDSSHISFLHAPIDHRRRRGDARHRPRELRRGRGRRDGRPRPALRGGRHGLRRGHRRAAHPARRALVLAHHAVPDALLHDAARPTSTRRSSSPTSGCRWTTRTWSTGW